VHASTSVLLALLLVGCASSPPAADLAPAALVAQLCDASAADDAEQRAAAFAESHDALHALARDLLDAGLAPEAGDVLEAKQRVEAALDAGRDAPPDLLSELAVATRTGVLASGRDAPTC